MASSNSNITAVHISLIVFVMLTLILGVLTFLGFRDLGDTQTKLTEVEKQLAEKETANRNMDEEIQALKQAVGLDAPDVGAVNPGPETVLAKISEDLRTAAQEGATQPNLHMALLDLSKRLNTAQQERERLQAVVNDEQGERDRQRSEYEQKLQAAEDARQAAEDARDQIQATFAERNRQKDAELAQMQDQFNQLRNEYQQFRETALREKNQLEADVANLTAANTRMWERLNELEMVSFEVADGMVQVVDHTQNIVYINLGSQDNLPERLNFSVYNKTHHGVGRGRQDIKGAIEVTRILGPNLAQARILDNNPTNPITAEDPVYTPLWSPGRVEAFAFVGLIDFDNDGISDRGLLRDLVATAGARITTEVDDEGNRIGGPINVETKFLVVGRTPDITVADEEQRAINMQIMEHFTEMQKEARIQGVRKINLADFLSYIGYKPKRRLWKPGMQVDWNLNAGAQSGGVGGPLGQRTSSGQVSGAFGSRFLKPKTSTGQTSELFRGKNGGY